MPNVDPAAKAWELELSGRVGTAIQARRKALKMTAQQLAERTKALGYPVSRVAISKIEGNLRAGKLDVAELLVLAAALEIPPALLLFPTFPDGSVEVLPEHDENVLRAREWMSGDAHLAVKIEADGISGRLTRPNPGVAVVAAVARLADLDARIANFRQEEWHSSPEAAESTRRMLEIYEEQLAWAKANINGQRAALWGTSVENESNG
jgi:transcriptional regulator with XRE-family HTH domain